MYRFKNFKKNQNKIEIRLALTPFENRFTNV